MRLTVILLLLAAACSSVTRDIRVETRRHADVDLRALQTYEWSASTAAVLDTTGTWAGSGADLDAVVREAIDAELGAMGLTQVASGGLLRVHVAVVGKRGEATEAQVRRGDAADESVVTEGSLLVELTHAPTDALVWRGIARSTATRVNEPAVARQRIVHAVHEMFEDFRD